MAWLASFLRAAAKLDVLDAFSEALPPRDVTPLVGEVTWCRGDTVAVFLWCFDPAGLIMFRGGGFEPRGPENRNKVYKTTRNSTDSEFDISTSM